MSIERALRRLSEDGVSVDEAFEILRNLQAELGAALPGEATFALLEFLRSGRDAPTGLGFEVGPGGVLREPPTLRIAMLDLLGQINIAQAEAYGSEWLDSPRSADEWAIGMRNVAWSAPDGSRNGDLQARFLSALGREDWRQELSHGFLETFDLAPYLGGDEIFTEMVQVAADPDAGSAGWAAVLSMDRMLLGDRVEVLSRISREPELLDDLPPIRAGLMARADVRVPEERSALEAYLKRSDVSADEAASFVGHYPNHDLVAGFRLFTSAEGDGRPMADVAAGDLAALEKLQEWQTDPEIAAVFKDQFGGLRERLVEYIASARRAAAAGDFEFE